MEAEKAELKARLEKALRSFIPPAVWDKFDGFGGPIEQYLEGSLEHEGGEKENFQSLKGTFRDELDYLKRVERETARAAADSAAGGEESTSLIEPEPSPDSYVGMRAKAMSECLAMLADEHPDVIDFRQRHLGGRLRPPKEASTIVDAPEGVSEDLRRLGNRLANDYYGWDEEGAIWYVLTGEAPQLRSVRIRARGKLPVEYYIPFQYDVTFSVLPWVPAKEVERLYRNAQKQLLEETPRETGPRILEVAQFCWEQYRTMGSMPSWPAWCELWNEAHPDKSKRFEKWRAFREYCLRGSKEAQPYYKHPGGQLPFQAYVDHYRGDRFIEAAWGEP